MHKYKKGIVLVPFLAALVNGGVFVLNLAINAVTWTRYPPLATCAFCLSMTVWMIRERKLSIRYTQEIEATRKVSADEMKRADDLEDKLAFLAQPNEVEGSVRVLESLKGFGVFTNGKWRDITRDEFASVVQNVIEDLEESGGTVSLYDLCPECNKKGAIPAGDYICKDCREEYQCKSMV